MNFWSKGLGKRSHLVIACGTEKPMISEDLKTVILYGMTKPPVVWNYTMTMEVRDFLSILELGFSKTFLKFLIHPKRMLSALKLLFYIILLIVKFPFVKRPSDQQSNIKEKESELDGNVAESKN